MVNKGSSFVDFVIPRPRTYARTQQSLSPLWTAIIYTYNYTACIDYFIIILILTIHHSTHFSFLQITSSLLSI